MKRAPFLLVTGFLGSGKTTFLKYFLEQYSKDKRIAVIQNEFAPGSVDGSELKRTGRDFEILEVNNGSVFCVCLLGSFVNSLSAFVREHNPDLVILEASGLSDPVSIGQMMQGDELSPLLYLSHSWCLVDGASFQKLARNMPRIRHQVRVADTVIINKTDLPGSDQKEIRDWIKSLNPFANIESTSYSRVPLGWQEESAGQEPVALQKSGGFLSIAGGGRPDLSAWVIKTQDCISRRGLTDFLEEQLPATVRMKGFVKLDDGTVLAVQSSYDVYSLETVEDYQGPTELIAMGQALDRESFEDRFRYYQGLL